MEDVQLEQLITELLRLPSETAAHRAEISRLAARRRELAMVLNDAIGPTLAAKRLGISRSELYARAIAKFMSEEAQVTAALDRVYANDAGKLDPTLGELQRRAHKRVEW